VSLPAPEPFGIDTDLSDEVGATGMEAPDLDNVLPVASADNFRLATMNGTGAPFGFSEMMKQFAGEDRTTVTKGTPYAGGGSVGTSGGRQDVVAYAKKFLGMQYQWGGSNPSTSFDCSGFVQYVLGKFGVHMPRISADQARAGKRTSLGNLQAGDLVAWDNSSRNNGADHIALYIGNGQIMEFSRPGRPSRIRKLGKNEGAWGVKINYGKG
jgi:cell wall-associated NlpC family hydrolase